MQQILHKTTHTLELIKFSHSIFALPFALSAMLLAAKGWPGWDLFFKIVAAMVTARSAAMAFNRLVDSKIDAKNPRTQSRHIPQGILSRKYVLLFTIFMSALFLFITSTINPLTFILSPFVLLFLLGYSFAKRFTSLCHFWLGASLGLAPLAAWVAVTGTWPWPVIFLGIAVSLWVAGFDIFYALQDCAFDKSQELHSLITKFGTEKSLVATRILHLISMILLIFLGVQHRLSMIYFIFTGIIGLCLFYEHSLVKPNDLSKINAAFFTMNGIISIVFLVGIILAVFKF